MSQYYLVLAEKEEFFKELGNGTKTEKDALKLIIDYLYTLETSISQLKEKIDDLSTHLGA
jgi:hypothetical protein